MDPANADLHLRILHGRPGDTANLLLGTYISAPWWVIGALSVQSAADLEHAWSLEPGAWSLQYRSSPAEGAHKHVTAAHTRPRLGSGVI